MNNGAVMINVVYLNKPKPRGGKQPFVAKNESIRCTLQILY